MNIKGKYCDKKVKIALMKLVI